MTSVQKGISSYQESIGNLRTAPKKYYSTFLPVGRENKDLNNLDEKSRDQDLRSFEEILKEKADQLDRH